MNKRTKFMTRVFSGDEAVQKEVAAKLEEAKEKGSAETPTESYGKVGDEIMVKDKTNGEVTSVTDPSPESDYVLEPVKVVDEAPKAEEEKKFDGGLEIAPTSQDEKREAAAKAEAGMPEVAVKNPPVEAEAAPKFDKVEETKVETQAMSAPAKTKGFADGDKDGAEDSSVEDMSKVINGMKEEVKAMHAAVKALCSKAGMTYSAETGTYSWDADVAKKDDSAAPAAAPSLADPAASAAEPTLASDQDEDHGKGPVSKAEVAPDTKQAGEVAAEEKKEELKPKEELEVEEEEDKTFSDVASKGDNVVSFVSFYTKLPKFEK